MHIVITGASSGIGEALAIELAKSPKNKLTLIARRETLLKELCHKVGKNSHYIVADLSDLDTCTQFVDEAEKKSGPIDVMINNAGIQRVGRTLELGYTEGEKLIRLNTLSPLKIIDFILPKMLKRGSGMIVNVASIAAFHPTPYMYYYSASKAAFGSASESLNLELKEEPVHILTVYPGPIATPMETRVKDIYEDSFLVDQFPSGDPTELAKRLLKR